MNPLPNSSVNQDDYPSRALFPRRLDGKVLLPNPLHIKKNDIRTNRRIQRPFHSMGNSDSLRPSSTISYTESGHIWVYPIEDNISLTTHSQFLMSNNNGLYPQQNLENMQSAYWYKEREEDDPSSCCDARQTDTKHKCLFGDHNSSCRKRALSENIESRPLRLHAHEDTVSLNIPSDKYVAHTAGTNSIAPPSAPPVHIETYNQLSLLPQFRAFRLHHYNGKSDGRRRAQTDSLLETQVRSPQLMEELKVSKRHKKQSYVRTGTHDCSIRLYSMDRKQKKSRVE